MPMLCFSVVTNISYGYDKNFILDIDRGINFQNKTQSLTQAKSQFKYQAQALEIVEKSQSNLSNILPINSDFKINSKLDTYENLVFVSLGIDKQVLKNIIKVNCSRDDTTLIWKGLVIRPNEKLFQGINRIQQILAETCPQGINSRLDPRLFEKYHIKTVPAVARVSFKGNLLGLKIGFFDPDVLNNCISRSDISSDKVTDSLLIFSNNKTSYLNSNSKQNISSNENVNSNENSKISTNIISNENINSLVPLVYEIVEKDLRNELQEAALQINWEEKRNKALIRFWNFPHGIYLPHAIKPSTYNIDLSFKLKTPLSNEKGEILFPVGTYINPLKLRQFNLTLIIFNPMIKDELDLVRKYLKAHSELRSLNLTKFIVTSLNFHCDDEINLRKENIFAEDIRLSEDKENIKSDELILPRKNNDMHKIIPDLGIVKRDKDKKNTLLNSSNGNNNRNDKTDNFVNSDKGADFISSCSYQGYQKLLSEFGSVYLLNKELVQRFSIKLTPTIISNHPTKPQEFLLATVLSK